MLLPGKLHHLLRFFWSVFRYDICINLSRVTQFFSKKTTDIVYKRKCKVIITNLRMKHRFTSFVALHKKLELRESIVLVADKDPEIKIL